MKSAEQIGVFIIRIAGYVMMVTAAYKIGDIWWAVLISGFIAWMPLKWVK